MRNVLLNWENAHLHGDLLWQHHRLRHRVFIEQMHWDVPTFNRAEWDQFDAPFAWYSIAVSDAGNVVGAARTMPTSIRHGSNSYMIRDAVLGKLEGIPANILHASPPTSPEIWEATRLCIEPGVPGHQRADIHRCIVDGLVRIARSQGGTNMISLSPPALIRWLNRIGYSPERLGPTIEIAKSRACVISMPI